MGKGLSHSQKLQENVRTNVAFLVLLWSQRDPVPVTIACHMFFPGTEWEEDRVGKGLGLSRRRKKFPKGKV